MRCWTAISLPIVLGCLATPLLADDPAPPPAKKGFFGQLGAAVKQGVNDGVNNGVQSAGSVRILGYTVTYSKLQRSNQRAFCLANADTGKLITVSPMFGSPYRRADGTTGFAEMAVPVDRSHSQIEVNLQGVLPGFTCADLIAHNQLLAYSTNGLIGTGTVAGPGMLPVAPAAGQVPEERSLIRKAAYEKCKPLLATDNARMDAFKACFNNALK